MLLPMLMLRCQARRPPEQTHGRAKACFLLRRPGSLRPSMLDLDALMAFLFLPTLQNWFLRHVRSGTPLIVKLQKMHSSPLDTLCVLCATLGNEFCLLLLLPLIAWNLDMTLGRKMILLWGIGFYTSNYLKDLLRLPRPCEISDEVVTLLPGRMSGRGNGLPCTRTFSCTALPFYLLFTTHDRFDVPLGWGVGLVLSWCVAVAFSRIYLGLHSPTDVLAGMIMGGLFVYLWLLVGDDIDRFLTSTTTSKAGGAWVPVLEPWVGWLLLLAYPAPLNCSLAFTETAVIGGFTTGWLVGSSWVAQDILRLLLLPFPSSAGRACLTSDCLWLVGTRSAVGFVVLSLGLMSGVRMAVQLLARLDGSMQPHESLAACRAMKLALLQRQQQQAGKQQGGGGASLLSSSLLHCANTTATGLWPSWYADRAAPLNGSKTAAGATSNGGEHHHHNGHHHHKLPQHHANGGGAMGLGLQHPKRAANHHSNGIASFSLPLSSAPSKRLDLHGDDPLRATAGLLSLWSLRLLAEKTTTAPPALPSNSRGGKGEASGTDEAQQAYYSDVLVPSVLFCAYVIAGIHGSFTVPLVLHATGLHHITMAA